MTNKITEKEKKPIRIVIVDDDVDLLKMMTHAFESQDFEVKVFTLGNDALNYFADPNNLNSTQLIILDRLLPDMDGLEILQQLSEKYKKKLPIVLILSVLDAEKDILKGLEMGAIDYLAKPFNLQVLIDQTRSLLNKYL
jgi:DNA-binding response OmpR family regulator